MLAELVKSGDLPPVEERLPKSPMVVEPAERVGGYGGSWRATMLPHEKVWLARTAGYELLFRWQPMARSYDISEIVPNVVESYEIIGDGSEYVLRFRAGIRWSDGTPFTSDDVLFAYNDVLRNEALSPQLPESWATSDGPAEMEKIDDETVRIVFPAPNGIFVQQMATKRFGKAPIGNPKHYLSQFHSDYSENAITAAKTEGFEEWAEMFLEKADEWDNPELPTLNPWVLTESFASGGNRAVLTRNPYYWKVDPDGSQLPYLDSFVSQFADPEVMVLKVANGEVDFQDRTVNSLKNKPVLAQSRQASGYEFLDVFNAYANGTIIALNMCHRNPIKRNIFRSRDFRVALSHAINREEIIKVTQQGLGEPYQAAPRPESVLYNETLGRQYTEYDAARANELLDAAGYSERNGQGVRLGPDGSPIAITIGLPDFDYGFAWPDVLEMVASYWQEVGIDVDVRAEGANWGNRITANEFDAAIWPGFEGLDPLMRPRQTVPMDSRWSQFALCWATWYQSGGSDGEEPPADVKEQLRIFDRIKATADSQRQKELQREMLAIAAEQFYSIGINLPPAEIYAIKRVDFHNVPEGYVASTDYPNPAPTNPEQYFTTRADMSF